MRKLAFINRGLLICLAFLVLLLIGGTIYGVLLQTTSPRHTQIETLVISGGGQTFSGIGRLRVLTSDPQPGTVIIFVSFVYYPEDRAFSEELVLRVRNFREIIVDFIGSFSIAELQEKDEESLKSELLRRFNAILRLGQLETLNFSDFIII